MRVARLLIGCLLFLVCFSSCRPKGVLSRPEMVEVLFDLHLTEAAVQEQYGQVPVDWTRGINPSFYRDLSYRSVLRKHHLSLEEFSTSVKWYSRHLNRYNKVYSDLMVRMEAFEDDIEMGKFDPFSNRNLQNPDSTWAKKLYTNGLFRRDTLPEAEGLALMGDTTPTWSKVYSRQWLYNLSAELNQWKILPAEYEANSSTTSLTDTLQAAVDSLNALPVGPDLRPQTPGRSLVNPSLRRHPPRTFRDAEATEEMRDRLRQRAFDQKMAEREESRRKAAELAAAARKASEEKAARDKAAREKAASQKPQR